MIHLRNNHSNVLVFVETLPENYVLNLRHNTSKIETNFNCVNDILVNTQTTLSLTNLEAGEYVYKLLVDDIIYERGLCKVVSDSLPVTKTYTQTTTGFKSHKK